MAITIRSLLTSGPVWVPLTTGSSARLSPGQTSGELADVVMAGKRPGGQVARARRHRRRSPAPRPRPLSG